MPTEIYPTNLCYGSLDWQQEHILRYLCSDRLPVDIATETTLRHLCSDKLDWLWISQQTHTLRHLCSNNLECRWISQQTHTLRHLCSDNLDCRCVSQPKLIKRHEETQNTPWVPSSQQYPASHLVAPNFLGKGGMAFILCIIQSFSFQRCL